MQITEQPADLFICHNCDSLQNISKVKPGNIATCRCCNNILFKNPDNDIDKPLALIIASLILFIVANIYPVMTLNIAGIEKAATLTDAALIFIERGNPGLAAIVWLSSVFIPGFIIFGLFYILISIHFNMHLPYTKPTLVWVSRFLPWGMMDVFFLGMLVSLVKLVALADILLGSGFYAFLALIFTYAAASASLEPCLLWKHLDKNTGKQPEACHE